MFQSDAAHFLKKNINKVHLSFHSDFGQKC